MAEFAVPAPPPPKKPHLTKQDSLKVASYENPFLGKGDDGKIYHLKPSEVGLGQVRSTERSYDSSTREKIFEFRSMYGQPPIFGKPCDIKLLDTTFEICALCGYGAFGQVYRVQIKGKPQKQFALKVLLARSGRRYVPDREFKVIASLEAKMFDNTDAHAHIIPFLAVAEHAEVQGIYRHKVQCGLVLMDFASNGELFDAIVQTDSAGEKTPNAFGSRFTRHLIRQAIFGLERLLASGYTHRDLKPDNMLFDAECNLVLCDLGHVKDLSEGVKEEGKSATHILATAMDRGTPRYNAPELHDATRKGIRHIRYDTMKSDIWALGITMFQMRSCICPMDVQDQLVKATYADLDIAPTEHGSKDEPDEFDVQAYTANARMWKKWDQFHKNISPRGAWNSTAWCRDYINEQFSPDERAFINLLLQKDPRCRVRLQLLSKAARGKFDASMPKGLAWIAKNDVPTDAEFKAEMAKRIPGFGGKSIVQKRVSRRQLAGLGARNKGEAVQAITKKLVAAGEFALLSSKPSASVEYTIEYKPTYGMADQPAIVTFEDTRHRLRVVCTVQLDIATGKVQCQFSRARGDAVLHLNFMRKFDTAFQDDDKGLPPDTTAAPAAAAASSASGGALTKDPSTYAEEEDDDDAEEEESSDEIIGTGE